MSDKKKKRLTRRQFIFGSAALASLAAVGGGFAARPDDNGRGGHDAYFAQLSDRLKDQGIMRPALVIDTDRVAENARTIRDTLAPGMGCRIAVKSVPSIDLIRHIRENTGTNKLMVFNAPFLSAIAQKMPDADILFGKPMPVAMAQSFYDTQPPGPFDPAKQVQWLIDTPERLEQYAELANERGIDMRVNIEIDVGLHRGGLKTTAALEKMLGIIDKNPRLTFSGLMGYDVHVAKTPELAGWQENNLEKSRALYKSMRKVAEDRYPDRKDQLTFNTGGSLTYHMHTDTTAGNEIALGSAFVKPSHYDADSLSALKPASFIATSVIKAGDATEIPIIEPASGLMAAWDRNAAKTFFIYGGQWNADPISPAGLQINELYGRSSNQDMLNGSDNVRLNVDDHVFLRPAESEAVFLQFGDIVAVKDGQIADYWPVFSAPTGPKNDKKGYTP